MRLGRLRRDICGSADSGGTCEARCPVAAGLAAGRAPGEAAFRVSPAGHWDRVSGPGSGTSAASMAVCVAWEATAPAIRPESTPGRQIR